MSAENSGQKLGQQSEYLLPLSLRQLALGAQLPDPILDCRLTYRPLVVVVPPYKEMNLSGVSSLEPMTTLIHDFFGHWGTGHYLLVLIYAHLHRVIPNWARR
jgi:hypothetical protein